MFLQLATLPAALAIGARAQNAAIDHFEKKIRPVLAAHCYACHSASAAAPQGGLLLDSRRGSGKVATPALRSSRAIRSDSLLIRALRHTDKKLKMPPGNPLAPEVVADFELWIREGAPLPADPVNDRQEAASLWSLQKPQLPAFPPSRTRAGSATISIASFLSRLEAQKPRAVARGRQANADPPGDLRLDRAAADRRRGRAVRQRCIAAGLRAADRSAARVAAIWRAMGTSLAGCCALFRFGERLGQRRAALSLVVHLSRLGDPRA